MTPVLWLSLFRTYLETGVLLFIGYGAYVSVYSRFLRGRRGIDSLVWLRVGRALLAAALFLPLAARLVPKESLFLPTAQVLRGAEDGGRESYAILTPVSGPSVTGQGPEQGIVLGQRIFLCLLAALAAGAATSLLKLFWDARRLSARLRELPCTRRRGRVRIVISDDATVPYSAWLPGRAYVVMPARFLLEPEDFRIAVRHELQHHRQGDTRWAYAVELLSALFFWNPAVNGWIRIFGEVQEFACDEILIGRRNVSPRAYGGCLLRAAEHAVSSRALPAGTAGMAAGASGDLLKRRLKMMLNKEEGKSRGSVLRFLPFFLGLGTLTLMATVAFAARSAIQDRLVTLAEGETLARRASAGSQIPIAMNELVLAQLNRFVGTPEGRAQVRAALSRMPRYQAMIEEKLSRFGMPRELLMVPIAEAGYKNFFSPLVPGAGLWGFIPSTAQAYGLTVEGGVDERLDEEKETGAAVRYFRVLHGMYGDWRLALKAYNEGEDRVSSLIEELGTDNPWEIEEAAPGKEHYLATVTALIIVWKNPRLVD